VQEMLGANGVSLGARRVEVDGVGPQPSSGTGGLLRDLVTHGDDFSVSRRATVGDAALATGPSSTAGPGVSKLLLLGSLLSVIKCIYSPTTYLHFIQDIEDRCLLLTSSTSFVDLPFQEHRMMEKHHMYQNPSIS
jgi:hypothetical protein